MLLAIQFQPHYKHRKKKERNSKKAWKKGLLRIFLKVSEEAQKSFSKVENFENANFLFLQVQDLFSCRKKEYMDFKKI